MSDGKPGLESTCSILGIVLDCCDDKGPEPGGNVFDLSIIQPSPMVSSDQNNETADTNTMNLLSV